MTTSRSASIAEVLEGLPKVLKPERRPRLKAKPKALSPADLQKAYSAALIKQSRAWPRKLNQDETLVALQRKWHLVYSNGVPSDLEVLKRVVPSGLKEREIRAFMLGAFEEAKMAFLTILNTSWTKADLERRVQEAGVPNALRVFDKGTRKSLEGAIRFLTD